MPNSRKQQRRREKPLKELRRACWFAAKKAAKLIEPHPSEEAIRIVAGELFRLSNPWCPGFHDAPLPSQRSDLRFEYAFIRLSDMDGTDPDQVARQLQATPDSRAASGPYTIGDPLPDRPPYADTHRAFKSLLLRKRQLRPKTP